MYSNIETIVSIVKVCHNTEKSVKKAVDLVGGMESVVNKGDKIYLKPNFVAPRESFLGVTTDFEIIRAVAEDVRRCGGIPVLFETPAIEFEKDWVFEVLGVRDFAKKNRIHLMEDPIALIEIPVPGGSVIKSIKIPRVLHNAKIINLPKLKTHVSAKMTCGMKNLIGLLPNSEKRMVHVKGVNASIADISRVFKPVLTVVDAITCMEGDGPTYGDKVDLGLIISGKDTISVDTVCCKIIGIPLEQVGYIGLSDKGSSEKGITVVGESIEDVRADFRIPKKGALFHMCFRLIYILDIIFSKIFPMSLNQFLYSTGRIGTNPKIIKERCDVCSDCLKVCPIEGALELDHYKINYKKCIRCMKCYFACNKKAIFIKGISHPRITGKN